MQCQQLPRGTFSCLTAFRLEDENVSHSPNTPQPLPPSTASLKHERPPPYSANCSPP